MKKSLKVLTLLFLVVMLTACGNNESMKKTDLNKTKEIVFNELHAEIPDVYIESSNNSYTDSEILSDTSSCKFSFETADKTFEETIQEELSLENFQAYTTNTKIINNHEWTYAEANSIIVNEKDYTQKGVYITINNDQTYVFVYTNEDPQNRPCDKLIEKVTNSFKFN